MTSTIFSDQPMTSADHVDAIAPVSDFAAAIVELSVLPDGTDIHIEFSGNVVTLIAPVMPAIRIQLPVGKFTVTRDLADEMWSLGELLADVHRDGEQVEASPWYLINALMIAAGETGVSI